MNKIKLHKTSSIIGLISFSLMFVISLGFVIKFITMYQLAYMFFPLMAMYMISSFVSLCGIIVLINRIRQEKKQKNDIGGSGEEKIEEKNRGKKSRDGSAIES